MKQKRRQQTDSQEGTFTRFEGLFSGPGVVSPIRSRRNRPCSCGSGKKFKLCCKRKS